MKDLTGQRYGRLVVLEEAERRISLSSNKKRRQWACMCDCGNKIYTLQERLTAGTAQSCGCLQKERTIEASVKHNMAGTRQYYIWQAMKKRCNNPNEKAYQYYKGRGILYDPKWETFEGFWEDMCEGYEDHLTLDRIDSNQNYCKENCRWATDEEQARNQRKMLTNTSGFTGVRFHDSGEGRSYWTARWNDINGVLKEKAFSINKLGNDLAFSLACEYRKQMIEQLNEMGAGYSETHGQ